LVALGRRWYVLVVGLILTAGAGLYVYHETPPDYTARSLVLLLPPVGTTENTSSNPFLQLGGLELTARVLVATYSGTAFQDEIAQRSPTAEVEVSMDESTQGGVIAVDVKDRGEDNAMSLLQYVTGTVSERLTSHQADVGVEKKDIVGSMLLAEDTEAKPDYQSLIRVLVIAVGGGIAVTVLVALALDAFLLRRVRRRRGLYVPHTWRERRKRAVNLEEKAAIADEPEWKEPTPRVGEPIGPNQPAMARRAVPGRSSLQSQGPDRSL
jgi:hypothetical protein